MTQYVHTVYPYWMDGWTLKKGKYFIVMSIMINNNTKKKVNHFHFWY